MCFIAKEGSNEQLACLSETKFSKNIKKYNLKSDKYILNKQR